MENVKCVMVIDESLPLGIAMNTAGVLGISLGKKIPECVGVDVMDQDGIAHAGTIQIPVPILKMSGEELKELVHQVKNDEELTMLDFTDIAQGCKVYDEYIERSAQHKTEEFTYYGIALFGNKKKVNKLTGSLPLYR
ncbi:DUF2000 domain-containing protein [[Eubacterium] hominis]|uniref:DUF2000 domain-containing protein n=1 Tax=[Eubacterium] hominis TaxID=2764325 RepID=UPI003A4DF597